jgi:hypothetical protein
VENDACSVDRGVQPRSGNELDRSSTTIQYHLSVDTFTALDGQTGTIELLPKQGGQMDRGY